MDIKKSANKSMLILFAIGAMYLIATTYSRGISRDLDYKVFHTVATRVVQGNFDLYNFKRDGVFSYKYSPFAALFFTPLALGNKQTTQRIWSIANTLATVLSFIFSWLLLLYYKNIKSDVQRLYILFISLLMLARPIVNNAMQGNINVMIYLLIIFSLYLAIVFKQDFIPALFLSLAISIKVVPLTIAGFFLFTKRYKFVGYLILLVTIFALLPFVYFGQQETLQLYHDWYLVLQDKQHFPFFKWTNQSPLAVWFRITGSLYVAKMIYYAHFLIATVLLFFTVKSKKEPLLVSLTMLVMLLLSPVVWIEYYVLMMFPIMLLNYLLFKSSFRGWKIAWGIYFIMTYGFGKFIVGKRYAELFSAWGQLYWGLLFMIILFITNELLENKLKQI